MIHLDIPHKPSIESFGLDTKVYLSEKSKEDKRTKRAKALDSIPWVLILRIIFFIFVGYLCWKYGDFGDDSIILKILKIVFLVFAFTYLAEFALCVLLVPFWLWKVLTDKYHPSFMEFFTDCFDGLLGIVFFPFVSLSQGLSKYSRTKTSKAYSQYCDALSKYESDIKQLRYKYPLIDECNWDEKRLTRRMVQELLPEAISASKEEVESINKYAEKRWWKQLEPKQFEYEVSEWFKKQGYTTEVTQFVADGGVDIIVEKEGQKSYVQCKQYKTEKVPIAVVRELCGVMASDGVSKGYIACLYGLSSEGAYSFARRNNITVIDIDALVEGTERVPVQEINNTADYIVGPFSILKDVFCSKDDAISHFSSRPELSISVLQIKNLYMAVYSSQNLVLHLNQHSRMKGVKIVDTRMGSK